MNPAPSVLFYSIGTLIILNTKSEALNPKQIRIPNDKNEISKSEDQDISRKDISTSGYQEKAIKT